MNKELFIGAIDLSPYFSECKKIRGGLEIRLKAVPWDVWCEFWLYFERGYNGNGFLMPLFIKWHQHEYCFHIHKTYHLGEVWGRGKHCIEIQTRYGARFTSNLSQLSQLPKPDIYKIQNIS